MTTTVATTADTDDAVHGLAILRSLTPRDMRALALVLNTVAAGIEARQTTQAQPERHLRLVGARA